MCGIVGFIGEDKNPQRTLTMMVGQVQHRGPDGKGIALGENFAVGHTRLSIVDLTNASSQPVDDGDFLLAYNGEIYNWRELLVEYKLDPTVITSDTLLIFYLLKLIPIHTLLPKLKGIYAFAFVDRTLEIMYLVRDQFGTKPLYLYQQNRTIYFASEIKAFLVIEGWRSRLDYEGLANYLSFQNNFNRRTIFRNVELIPAATIIKIESFKNPKIEKIDVEFSSSNLGMLPSSQETIYELQELLERTVNYNLNSDVDVGGFLSSGIDSTIIAALAKKTKPDFKTFSIGFNMNSSSTHEADFDETFMSSKIAKEFGLRNFQFVIGPRTFAQAIDRVSWIIEDPRVGQSYPNFFAAELASQHVKVCLSGVGGDELFAGYVWRYMPILAGATAEEQHSMYFNSWHRLGSPLEISRLLRMDSMEYAYRARMEFQAKLEVEGNSRISLKNMLDFERKTFLHGLLLVEDKLSMANGLEVRVPFLDNDLLNFTRRLPDSLLLQEQPMNSVNSLRDNFNYVGKIALRKVAENVTPLSAKLRKQGFSAPDATWFANDLNSVISERLLDPKSIIWDYLDYETGKELITIHQDRKSNRRLLIWSLLTLESTLRQFSFSM